MPTAMARSTQGIHLLRSLNNSQRVMRKMSAIMQSHLHRRRKDGQAPLTARMRHVRLSDRYLR